MNNTMNQADIESQFNSFAKKISKDLAVCIDSHLDELKKQVCSIITKMNLMEKEITYLHERVEKLESDGRSCDLVVTQIPVITGEKIPEIVRKIGDAINFNCKNHLFNAFRIKSNTSKNVIHYLSS